MLDARPDCAVGKGVGCWFVRWFSGVFLFPPLFPLVLHSAQPIFRPLSLSLFSLTANMSRTDCEQKTRRIPERKGKHRRAERKEERERESKWLKEEREEESERGQISPGKNLLIRRCLSRPSQNTQLETRTAAKLSCIPPSSEHLSICVLRRRERERERER